MALAHINRFQGRAILAHFSFSVYRNTPIKGTTLIKASPHSLRKKNYKMA